MLTRYIALVAEKADITMAELSAVAGALQKQAIRDFGPAWGVLKAIVSPYKRLADVPLGYWPIVVKDRLDRPDAAGYHEDEHGQPCSLVLRTDDWTVTASHEMLEMLADPWGRHLVSGPSPCHPGHQVRFLVEVCDPCPDATYQVDGVTVSDFYTPRFFDPASAPDVRYSHRGRITEPRQVLKGGYLTWYDPALRQWWRRAWFSGDKPTDAHIPIPPIRAGNIRAAIDQHFAGVKARRAS